MTKSEQVASGSDLRAYAAIGDGRTVALIGSRGQIDWMPTPDLDEMPVFARLLDDKTGGSIQLAPTAEFTVSRKYVDRTNVLETTFTTEHGRAKVTDALVTGAAGRLPWAQLVRRIDGIEGEVAFAWRVDVGTALHTVSPWVQKTSHGDVIRAGDVSIAVIGGEHGPKSNTKHDSGAEAAPASTGTFTTQRDSRHVIAVVATSGEPLHIPGAEDADRGVDRTISNWRSWSREFSYDGPWERHVQRSALALKLLIFSPTGAIAAAATSSLPENPAGGKNWDYRFAWVRDLAYTASALVHFGLREETHAAVSWLLRSIRESGPELHIFYSLNGSAPDDTHVHEVPGWRGIGPVVTGNPAQGQLQLGVYGDLFSVCRVYVDAGNVLDIETGRMLAVIADRVCDVWRERDAGMWELPGEQHYTSSKMGCWQALNDAVHLAEIGQVAGSAARWAAERDRIREWIEANCWSEEARAYTMHPDTTDLDASVLLHAPSGFDRGERMSSTIDAITGALGDGSLVYRYSGVEREEHTFVACAFWRAGALACVGRHAEAIELMDDLVTRGNDVGLFSEMISARDGSFWGNLPQGLSHLALINTAIIIREVAGEAADGH
ncbi:GH15 family glucan-1,4-alpha-glucosidase [Microbacterium endophyticum]|uniref:GH15 family glucan-1,4-alpha-glucosidase n=1 Tax=Microbacterium endophyticum TaxID=1526412 RepID=A0A7W4V493_9MICO|nr:glycoside hydrolase family 15 protein [Microbacterium endophyticum]MBB2975903.1 GH15 family glucan-1,4-alpha-glucosidase [Microbacterium endophyticum]NIK36386.1 GH15 family glucan-1,4-alpha-glucosidase [Microbacterium endophyticum]